MLDLASSRPLYQQLARLIRERLETGGLSAGAFLDPETDIAENYGVSRGTVREAIDLLVGEGRLERVPGKGVRVALPDPGECIRRVGMIVPYLRDSLSADILRGIEGALRTQRYSLIYSPSENDITIEVDQIKQLQGEKICGLLLMPISHQHEAVLISQALAPGLPMVLIDRGIPGYEASGVFVDNYGGAVAVVNHLLSLGHRKIACISGAVTMSTFAERVRGYEESMRSAGLLPLAALRIDWFESAWKGEPAEFPEESMEPIEIMLRSPDRPTALFCANDHIAYTLMHYLLLKGVRIPQDMAIAGFDDLPLAAYMPVPLTTVAQPRLEIGNQAAQLLLKMIEKGIDKPQQIVLPVSLVIRESTVPV